MTGTVATIVGGGRFATGSDDGTVIVWTNLKEPQPKTLSELKERACKRVGRNMSWSDWSKYRAPDRYRRTCPDLDWPIDIVKAAPPGMQGEGDLPDPYRTKVDWAAESDWEREIPRLVARTLIREATSQHEKATVLERLKKAVSLDGGLKSEGVQQSVLALAAQKYLQRAWGAAKGDDDAKAKDAIDRVTSLDDSLTEEAGK